MRRSYERFCYKKSFSILFMTFNALLNWALDKWIQSEFWFSNEQYVLFIQSEAETVLLKHLINNGYCMSKDLLFEYITNVIIYHTDAYVETNKWWNAYNRWGYIVIHTVKHFLLKFSNFSMENFFHHNMLSLA